MISHLPLRLRVTLLFTLMGVLLSAAFACTIDYIAEAYEHVLVEEVLASHVEDFSVRYARDPTTALPNSQRLRGYLQLPDGGGNVPEQLSGLTLGVHEPEFTEDDGIHVGVFDVDAGRLFLWINLGSVEKLEVLFDRVLIVIMLAGTLLSAALGWLLAGSFVKPVRQLAAAVNALPSQPQVTELSKHLPADELGQLGRAIDNYQNRLLEAERAEQGFLADASHELRTPIAVVRGATELLQEDAAGIPVMQPRLQRLDRGVTELTDLLDALLRLARHRIAEPDEVMLLGWLRGQIQRLPAIRDGRVSFTWSGDDCAYWVPLHDAELLMSGLLRRLLPPASFGVLELTMTAGVITLFFRENKASASPASRRPSTAPSDRRLVSTLMGRLASRMDWRIDDSRAEDGQLRIELPMSKLSPPETPSLMA